MKNNNKKLLTVSIPTWDREDNLKLILERLAPQLDEDCIVNIIVNNSSYNVDSMVESVMDRICQFDYKIYTNRENIGGSANVVECFRKCNTQWNFIIGDSKLPSLDVINTLKRQIVSMPNVFFVNYYYPSIDHSVRDKSSVVCSNMEFLSNMGSFGNVILLGNSLYSNHIVKKYIGQAYQYLNSWSPQFAIVVLAMRDGKKEILLSNNSVIEGFLRKPAKALHTQSLVDCWIGFSELLDIFEDDKCRQSLINNIFGYSEVSSMNLLSLIKAVLLLSYSQNRGYALHMLYRATSIRHFYGVKKYEYILIIITNQVLKYNFLHKFSYILYKNIRNQ